MKRFFGLLLLVCFSVPCGSFGESPPTSQLQVTPDQVFSVWGDGTIYYCVLIRALARAGDLQGVTGDRFIPYGTQIKRVKRKLKKKKRGKRALRKQLTELKQTRALGDAACQQGGSGTAPEPFFDTAGNLSSRGRVLLEIPAGLNANLNIGKDVFEYHCTGCHDPQVNRTFPMYRERTSQEPMFFTEQELPDVDLAHLTAYLNRFRN